MLSLGLTSYEMELGFSELFTSYERELETHVHDAKVSGMDMML